MEIVDSVIDSLHEVDEDFELTDKGSLDKYIGVLIEDIDDTSFEISQLFLIKRIIAYLSLDEHNTRGQETPVGKPLLNHDLDECNHKHIKTKSLLYSLKVSGCSCWKTGVWRKRADLRKISTEAKKICADH